MLIQIDEQPDFAKLVEPLEDCYCPNFCRPAIHPSRGDGQRVAGLLTVQHRVFPATVLILIRQRSTCHVLNIRGESYRLREKRQAGLFPSHQQLNATPEEAGDNHNHIN